MRIDRLVLRNWSPYQRSIFDSVSDMSVGDLVVQARAGSGKTSTCIEALRHVPKGEGVLMVAFNKGIANEMASRAPAAVEVSTLHSYGYRIVRKAFGGVEVNSKRVRDMVHATQLPSPVAHALVDTVSTAKSLLLDSAEEIDHAIDRFCIDEGWAMPKLVEVRGQEAIQAWIRSRREEFVTHVLSLLEKCRRVTSEVDFDDMVWLPVTLNLKGYRYDRVFVDECQDISPVQIELVLRALKLKGRLVAVGDTYQQIYGWRHARADLLDPELLDPVPGRASRELPLPICYRCAKGIVKAAQGIVPDIEPWEGSPEGAVEMIAEDRVAGVAREGDFILSRTNAPLVGLWLELVSAGKVASILGHDMAKSIVSLIKRSKAETIAELQTWTERWLENELIRLDGLGRGTLAVRDKARCVLKLSEGVSSIGDVLRRIDRAYATKDNALQVTLSTTHRAKGLERDRVFMLGRTYRTHSQEERNLAYVAMTRARDSLFVAGDQKDWDRLVEGQTDFGRAFEELFEAGV